MVTELTVLAEYVVCAGKNLAYNLQFIPANRLDWKPAPTAKSALEIVNHCLDCLGNMAPVLRGEPFQELGRPYATDLASARALLHAAVEEYAAALRGVAATDLDRVVDLPHGRLTLRKAGSYEAVDLLHHHGQIAYIQSLLGDTESHFVE